MISYSGRVNDTVDTIYRMFIVVKFAIPAFPEVTLFLHKCVVEFIAIDLSLSNAPITNTVAIGSFILTIVAKDRTRSRAPGV